MKKLMLALCMLLGLTLQSFADTPAGNPNQAARLEFIYTSTKFIAKLDGQDLSPGEGMKVVTEASHGKHLIEVYAVKGLFKVEKHSDVTVELPGGYLTRISLNNGEVQVLDTVPLPGSQPVAAAPATEQVTTTVSTTAVSGAPSQTVSVGVGMGVPGMAGMEGVGLTMNVSGMDATGSVGIQETTTTTTTTTTAAAPVAVRPSKLVVMSEEGMCSVYIDGKKRVELSISGIDEMASGTVFDLMPGSYQLKIEGFDVWYEGILKVGSGEEIKLRAEPGSMKEIGRNPLP